VNLTTEEAKARLARDVHGTFCSELERQYRAQDKEHGLSPINPVEITYLDLYALDP